MKKSELTAFIKEEIKSTLNTEGVWSKGDDTAIRDFILDVEQLKDDYYNIVGSDDVFDGLDAAIRAANDLIAMNEATIETSPEDLAKVKQTADKDDVIKVTEEDELSLNDISQMMFNMDYDSLSPSKQEMVREKDEELFLKEDEDKEPSKADLKKTKGLAKAKEELAQLTKQMKSLARKYKEAEGEEKEKLVADLKKKTKLKKELEAIIDK